eukprot:4245627-Pyramimonas_sp.AAC.1
MAPARVRATDESAAGTNRVRGESIYCDASQSHARHAHAGGFPPGVTKCAGGFALLARVPNMRLARVAVYALFPHTIGSCCRTSLQQLV